MHKITDFKPLFKVAGRKFYEHPIHGDEAGVIMEYSGRAIGSSMFTTSPINMRLRTLWN